MKHLRPILNAKKRFLASLSHVQFEIEMPGGGRKTVAGYLDICRIPANKYPKDYKKYSVRHSKQKGRIPHSPSGTYFIICEIEHEGKRHEIMMTSSAPYGNVYSSPEHWPSCKYCNQIQKNGL